MVGFERHERWSRDGIFGVQLFGSDREFVFTPFPFPRWHEVDRLSEAAQFWRGERGPGSYYRGFHLERPRHSDTFWIRGQQVAVRLFPRPSDIARRWVDVPPPPVGGASDLREAVLDVQSPPEECAGVMSGVALPTAHPVTDDRGFWDPTPWGWVRHTGPYPPGTVIHYRPHLPPPACSSTWKGRLVWSERRMEWLETPPVPDEYR